MWSEEGQRQINRRDKGSDESSSEEDSSEEESSDNEPSAAAEDSREARKDAKRARKAAAVARSQGNQVQVGDMPPSGSESEDEDVPLPSNPNHSKAARKQAIATDDNEDAGVVDAVAQKMKKMHIPKVQMAEDAKGKEDELRKQADLERLQQIREKRELEKARREVSFDFDFDVWGLMANDCRPRMQRKRSRIARKRLISRPARPRRGSLRRARRAARRQSRSL